MQKMKPKTWSDIKKFDDLITPEGAVIIRELNAKDVQKCPYLKKKGNLFYYCDSLKNFITAQGGDFYTYSDKPEPGNCFYESKLSLSELQLWCMNKGKKYSNCVNYK